MHVTCMSYNVHDDSVEEVTALFPVHRVGEEMKEGRVIPHGGWTLVLGAACQLDILVEGA